MADIRCPSCGKNNPDFLDNCQFCQTPLKSEAMVHPGESPVKKNTGELEPILPQWLKDVRQQGRESAAKDAEEEAAKPKVQKNEPPDLLAGLASQTKGDEEEIPDWLASMNPVTKPSTAAASTPPPEADFFAQFEKSEPAIAESQTGEPAQESVPSWMAGSNDAPPEQAAEEKDELSAWFAQASAEPAPPVEVESDVPEWTSPAELPSYAFKEPPPQPKAEEDLSWLRSLEDSSKQESEIPSQDETSQSQSELGWLDSLGTGTDVPPGRPATDEPPSWVRKLGGVETPAQAEEPQQELSWMNQLSSPESKPVEEKPAESNPVWLQDIEGQQGAETPAEKVSPFTRRTGPLSDVPDDLMPDWLKSATEEPSMPAPGALSDWFRKTDLSPQAAPAADSDSLSASPPSSSDVDSLLSVDMPDWLSRSEPVSEEVSSNIPGIPADDSLAPGELPSWIKEMRPAESAIPGASSRKDQYTESEGPLAGLEGVIPVAPIGSSRRPKTVSIKLQPTDEQFAGATLLEQILASETTARPITAQANIASQRTLRWILSGLFLIVLSVMAFLQTTSMPVSASLPPEVRSASSAIARLPQNSLVLVVMDYEPALAGEMEAVSGPMLDQLVLSTHARLAFVSTSPNNTALVRRLLTNTGVSLPAPNGLDYKAGENYVNLGYLPGGLTGIREFLDSPAVALPQAGLVPNFSVTKFTEYAAVIVLTDHAESGRVWVEQLYTRNRTDTTFFSNQPVLFATSAQAGPMMQPYYSSQQITGMVNGLSDAARYEFVNNSRPGIARRYWDSFGVGLLMAVVAIALGSLWSLVAGIRASRISGEAG